MIIFYEILCVGFGGFIGAVLRYSVYILCRPMHTHTFPLSTLLVNVIGSGLLGGIAGYFVNRQPSQSHLFQLFIVFGMLGSFTTFSAFSYESILLYRDAKFIQMGFYVLLQISACFLTAGLAYHYFHLQKM